MGIWWWRPCSYLILWWLVLGSQIQPGYCNQAVGEVEVRFRHLTVKDGLSQSSIYTITQDAQGFMWFGTVEGLNRYDGYTFRKYYMDPGDPHSLSNDWITALAPDPSGHLWVGTAEGLNRYDPVTDRFTRVVDSSSGLLNTRIRALLLTDSGQLWIGSQSGLSLLDLASGKIKPIPLPSKGDDGILVKALYLHEDQTLWVGTENNGVVVCDNQGNPRQFLTTESQLKLSHNRIRNIQADASGAIWIGTEMGLNRYLSPSLPVQHFFSEPGQPVSLASNIIRAIYLDREERLWVATNMGLHLWRDTTGDFARYQHNASDDASLPTNDILSLHHDNTGVFWVGIHGGLSLWNASASAFRSYSLVQRGSASRISVTSFAEDEGGMWVGTYGDGLSRLNMETGQFHHIRKASGVGLEDDRIGSLLVSSDKTLWVGTFKAGLHRYNRETARFDHFSRDPENPHAISANAVTSIKEDPSGLLYITTYGGGLNRMDPGNGRFQHFRYDGSNPNSIAGDNLICQVIDSDGLVWLGSVNGGLSRFDPDTGKAQTYRHQRQDPFSLGSDTIFCLLIDSNDTMWLGTAAGLNAWESKDRKPGVPKFRRFTRNEGIITNLINGIVPGQKNRIWLSTNMGLVRFNTITHSAKMYGAIHGLQGDEFNTGAYFRAKDGRIFFGGVNGFDAFYAAEILPNPYEPHVVLEELLIANKPLKPAPEDKEAHLQKTLDFTEQITLSHEDDFISFEFAGLHYVDPPQNGYAYILEGLNEEWIYTPHRHASFTTLDAGNYTFKVKASNHDGLWSAKEASVRLRVLPPPWKSPQAYGLYGLTWIVLVGFYLHVQRKRFARKQQIIERLQQVDRLKDDFLANTSHELRTPLSGIIGLAESLLDGAAGAVNERQSHHLHMLVDSGRRLSLLVDDILDFSKLRNKGMNLKPKPLDLFALTDVVLTMSKPLLGDKEVAFVNKVPKDLPAVMADENRLIQILYNLVGNAAKFTEKGVVSVGARERGDQVDIWVRDTGCGIPRKDLTKIFRAFQQLERSNERTLGGTGLGLAITQELVTLHGGELSVESQVGEGSKFLFNLPKSEQGVVPEDRSNFTLTQPRLMLPTLGNDAAVDYDPIEESDSAFTLLIVDDEPVNRQVMVNYLNRPKYKILVAADGPEALDLIEREEVDLVLLDIMMPHMSGYDVCRKLRLKYPIKSLPVIFLTARNQLSDLTAGFSAGANDYLIKPISKKELLCRVGTHLALLDINRTLERRVVARTQELAEINEEMATLDTIVKTVNREMTLQRVLRVLLEQSMAFFSQAEKGAFIFYDHSTQLYKVASAMGHDVGLVNDVHFTREEVLHRYTANAEQVERGVFLLRNVPELAGHDLPIPACLLSMAITSDGELEGFLVFSHFSDPSAFDDTDLRKLKRFREHALSAVAKARFLEELQNKNEEILRTQNQLIMREKMVSLGTLTSGIAHEIKNPLNFINNFSRLSRDLSEEGLALLQQHCKLLDRDTFSQLEETLESLKENQDLIGKHGAKADHIVKSMMMLSREGVSERQRFPLNKLVDEYTSLAIKVNEARFEDVAIQVYRDYGDDVGEVDLVVQNIGRVILSLITNSMEALADKFKHPVPDEQPSLWISTEAEGDDVLVRVRDNGIGIPRDISRKLFTPFFTTKQNESNIGLGLFISYDIVVQEHHGNLSFLSDEGDFCEFTLRLPRTG